MIFGRTDLRIGQSEAKFDAEADFNVRSAAAPQKPDQIDEKPFSRSKKIPEILFRCRKMKCCKSSETRFDKFWGGFGPCLGVNGRSKFWGKKINRQLNFLVT